MHPNHGRSTRLTRDPLSAFRRSVACCTTDTNAKLPDQQILISSGNEAASHRVHRCPFSFQHPCLFCIRDLVRQVSVMSPDADLLSRLRFYSQICFARTTLRGSLRERQSKSQSLCSKYIIATGWAAIPRGAAQGTRLWRFDSDRIC
jgi:hypothetical protein